MTLDHYLVENKISTAEFALLLKVKFESVRRYRRNGRIPDTKTIARIFELTGGQVTANDFHGIGAEIKK